MKNKTIHIKEKCPECGSSNVGVGMFGVVCRDCGYMPSLTVEQEMEKEWEEYKYGGKKK